MELPSAKRTLISLGVCAVLGVGIYYFVPRTPGEPSTDSLVTTALTAPDSAQRVRAVVELGQKPPHEGNVVIPNLRKLVNESKDAEVVAVALHGLKNFHDFEPLQYVYGMEHEDARVRDKGWIGLQTCKNEFWAGLAYKPDAPLEARKQATQEARKRIEEYEKRSQIMRQNKNAVR